MNEAQTRALIAQMFQEAGLAGPGITTPQRLNEALVKRFGAAFVANDIITLRTAFDPNHVPGE